MNTRFLATAASPAGPLHIAVTDAALLTNVAFGVIDSPDDFERSLHAQGFNLIWDDEPAEIVLAQLAEYASGGRTAFDLPLEMAGSEWERQVWAALQTIPFGETRSYGQIATQLGDASKARAVGWANAANPVPVIVPCHRVIGANGNLTGFGGGIDAKIKLLAHEGAMLPGFA